MRAPDARDAAREPIRCANDAGRGRPRRPARAPRLGCEAPGNCAQVCRDRRLAAPISDMLKLYVHSEVTTET